MEIELDEDFRTFYAKIKEYAAKGEGNLLLDWLVVHVDFRTPDLTHDQRISSTRLIVQMITCAIAEVTKHCGIENSKAEVSYRSATATWAIRTLCPECGKWETQYETRQKRKYTLRQIRDARGLTLEEAARRSGVPEKALNLWERDCRKAPASQFVRLAAVYQIPMDKIHIGPEETA